MDYLNSKIRDNSMISMKPMTTLCFGVAAMEVAFGFHGREAVNVLFNAAKVKIVMPRKQEDTDLQVSLRPASESSLSAAWSGVGKRKKVMSGTGPKTTEDAVAEYAVSFTSQVGCLFLRCVKVSTRDLVSVPTDFLRDTVI
ncbi:unnamed protein product, partial [Darwinula stevensoni]